MKAVILAAGRGSRMKEGTSLIPKCMMKLFDKTLLQHCLTSLKLAGLKNSDICIVTGYKKEKIKAEGIKKFYNQDWEHTNMVASLMVAEEWFLNESCIICYSDILFHPSCIKYLMNSNEKITITYYTKFWELWAKRFSNPLNDLETFKIKNGKLIEIGKKTENKSDIQGQYMGLLGITPEGWKSIRRTIENIPLKLRQNLDMTTLLQNLLTNGEKISIIPTDKLWLECDNQNDIRVYEKEFYNYYKSDYI